ncbi:MAG TPA: response regulator [Terriglobia bacterium]|nr:response regulator [Terriglobia bacterium]
MKPEHTDDESANLLSDLRRRAEEMLWKQPAELEKITPEETKRLLHELRVHQIELELQNEELRRAQLDLAASREKYFDLYDLAPVGYLTINEKGLILEANLTVASLLGLERTQLIKQPVTHFIFREDQDIYYRHRKLLLESQAGHVSELRMLRRDGAPFWARIESILTRGSDNDVLLCQTTVSDITARKLAEEQRFEIERGLQQTQKLESLGVLAGGVAHDFNNLLLAILGHADLAMEELPPLSPALRRIEEISKTSLRAADLCLQMLAYAGKGHSDLKRVDLRALVEEMAHLLKTCISKKAALNLKLEQKLPPIQADASQIRQIVMNLTLNASEALGEHSGVITISTGARESNQDYLRGASLGNDLPSGVYVYLEVSDTGCGMDAETQKRIFEPFFTTKFLGRGLGLSAVQGIVRTHKGALRLYSEPSKGTTLRVLFPALSTNEEETTETTTEASARAWRGSGTVLLVDDETIVRDVVREMLQFYGFSVLTAMDGKAALDLYRERGREISLVLLDMTMPHMDGAETFRALRQLNPVVPVILSSGYAEQDVTPQFAGKGLNGFLQKPYTLENLQTKLSQMMSPPTSKGSDRDG